MTEVLAPPRSLVPVGDKDAECEREAPPEEQGRAVHRRIPHIRQSYNWDCGLACALMVLHAHGMKHVDLAYLCGVCTTKSIWTVDLAYLLRHFKLGVLFCTKYIGANPAYEKEKFYSENLTDDGSRVERLFRGAHDAGVDLQNRSVPLSELRRRVSSGGSLAVVLVDKRKLVSPTSSGLSCLPKLSCCRPAASGDADEGGSSYVGHYILLCGHDAGRREFLVKDPASLLPRQGIKENLVEAARKSFGTDEDVLFVS